jgi:hypothetical protein
MNKRKRIPTIAGKNKTTAVPNVFSIVFAISGNINERG